MTEFERTRIANGFTQKSLAEALKVDQSTVSRWERETGGCFPEPKMIPAIAALFQMTGREVTHLFDPQPQPEQATAAASNPSA